MKLIEALAYYKPDDTPWAAYICHKANHKELFTDIDQLTPFQICDFADMVAAHGIDPTMTPYTLKRLLNQAEVAMGFKN